MFRAKKNATGDNGGAIAEGLDNVSSCPEFTTTGPILQLLAQAERRMMDDPNRYGCHFAIWLSVWTLSAGLEWAEVSR